MGHDCCGGATTGTTELQIQSATETEEHAHDGMGGCGEGCGCGNNASGDACATDGAGGCCGGHGAEQALHPMEGAALRGFLTGLHASRLSEAELKEYLTGMATDAGSEFARPAQFLGQQLEELAQTGQLDSAAPGVSLLEAISAASDAQDDLDNEDGSEE